MKSDKSEITVIMNDEKHNTNRNKLGSLVGDYVEIGCNSVLNPGTVIGKNTTIYPLSMVRKELKENIIFKNDGTNINKEL